MLITDIWYVSFIGKFLFFLNFIYFTYLFLAALGLRCCVRAFSSCVDGLLIAVASLVVEHGL